MRLQHRGAYPEHQELLAEAVKRAAGNRCIRCGHPAGDRKVSREEWFAGEGDELRRSLSPCTPECHHNPDGKLRALTVHHLDGDKGNDAWWNLLALCQVCHLIIQGRLIPERPWLFEHADWFKPYVAGFYAWQLGANLSRAEVEANLDHWLTMGQPWLGSGTP